MLANITHAWVLYYGLMFVAMILWAPGGLAGLIMMHKPLWQGRVMAGVLRAYAVIAGPVIILFLGCMVFIEINYHLSLSIKPEDPHAHIRHRILRPIDLAHGIISIALSIGGLVLFLRSRRIVSRAWQTAGMQLKQKDSGS